MTHSNSWTGYEIPNKSQQLSTKRRILTPADFPTKTEWSSAAEKYLLSRGIDREWVDTLPNVYPVKNGICFLLDVVFGYTIRTFTDSLRWLNAPKVSLAAAVFAIDGSNRQDITTNNTTLYIVEGPTDALAIAQEGCIAVATLGALLPTERLHTILKNIGNRKVVIIPDADIAGMTLATRLLKELPDSKVCWCGYKDFANMPRCLRADFLFERNKYE